MATAGSELDDLFPGKKRVKNPFVPIGALVTAGVLRAGLISFRREFSIRPEVDASSCGCTGCYCCTNG